MLTPYQPCVGVVPVYVNYFEELDPNLGARKREFAETLGRNLRAAAGSRARVISTPMVSTTETARRAVEDLVEAAAEVIVVAPLIAVFGELLVAACPPGVPILILSLSPEDTIPSDFSMARMVTQSSGLGMQALANTLTRAGRSYEICAGAAHDPVIYERAIEVASTLALPARLRATRMGVIGSRFPSMTDVALDLEELRHHTGIESVGITSDEWTSAYRGADPADIIDYCRASFAIEALTDGEMQRSAKLAAALESICERHNIGFGAVNSHGPNCLRNPEIGVMATLGVSLLSTRGIPLAEVGDLPTAIAMAIAKLLTGAAIYAELDSIDFRRSRWFIANSGELDLHALPCGAAATLRGSENFRGLYGRGASFEAALKPGPATLLSFTPAGIAAAPYRIIAAEGEICDERLTGFHAVHALMAVDQAPRRFENWCRAGAVHHAALATDHLLDRLRVLRRAWPIFDLVEVAA